MTPRQFNLSVILMAPLVFVLTVPVSGIDFTWDGIGGNDSYFTNGNWFGGTAPTGTSGNADRAIFNSTATGAKLVNIGAATITDQLRLVSGADGFTFNGTGQWNANFDINTTGANTFNIDVNAGNNFGWQGGGTTNVDAHFNRADTITRRTDGTTINVRNGGELSFNRLRVDGSSATTVNVEAGGLVTSRFVFHHDANDAGIINVSGTVDSRGQSGSEAGISMRNDDNRLIINDGGVVFGRLSMQDDGDGSESTVDLFPGATLALLGGDASTDTLAEFYALTQGTQGLDGDNFRFGDGSVFTDFDLMIGTGWFDLNFEPDFMGTESGFTVLTTFAIADEPAMTIPEPSTLVLSSLGLLGMLALARRRKR